jgi:hypothetical protein
MTLDTSRLRAVVDETFPNVKSRLVTLIRIGAGDVRTAIKVSDKRELLATLETDDTLLAVWTGQYSSDRVPAEYLARWKKA